MLMLRLELIPFIILGMYFKHKQDNINHMLRLATMIGTYNLIPITPTSMYCFCVLLCLMRNYLENLYFT